MMQLYYSKIPRRGEPASSFHGMQMPFYRQDPHFKVDTEPLCSICSHRQSNPKHFDNITREATHAQTTLTYWVLRVSSEFDILVCGSALLMYASSSLAWKRPDKFSRLFLSFTRRIPEWYGTLRRWPLSWLSFSQKSYRRETPSLRRVMEDHSCLLSSYIYQININILLSTFSIR